MPADTGVAIVNCAIGCTVGDSCVLNYSAHVQQNDPSGKGEVLYALHLEGTISSVPIPAAAWLFGSGLFGLVGMARRKRQK